jgi:superfamily II DNA or RNA helicase
LRLRPYQRAALVSAKAEIDAGRRRVCLVSPGGSGKTVTGAAAVAARVQRGQRVVWFAHRRELMTQAADTLRRFDLAVGVFGVGASAPVQIRSAQESIARGEVPPADFGVIDECHHYSADLWKTIPDAYPDADLLGLTATPERGDGRPLDHLFNALVVVAQPEDMVDLWRATEGRSGLVPCHVERPNRALKGLARSPAKATVLHKLRDHQQICFAPHVLAGELYVAQFREIGVSVSLLTGKTPTDERDAILARFAERKTRVVVNCQVLTEGWDCPAVDVVTLGGPCSSVGSLIQKATRGSRPAPGKTRFVVLDLPGCTWTLGHPFEDREYSLEGRGISTGKKLVRLDLCKRCGDAMPDDGDTCSREGCGWTRPALEVPKVLEERLERWEWRRQMATDERVTKMVQWMRAAMHKGLGKKATGIAIHTYRGYFHDGDPSAEIIRHACAIVGNRPWCSTCNHSVREGRCQCPVLTSNAETGT